MKKHLKILLFAFLFLGISNYSFGQDETDSSLMELKEFVQKTDSLENIICIYPPMPEFPGGEKALNKFLKDNLVYPDSALKNNIQGKVYMGFVVEKDGSISGIKTVGKKTHGYGLEEEALRVVKLMPNWKPGNQNGKPMSVKYTLPIKFKLSDLDTTIYDVVDEMPEFVGGKKAILKYITDNLVLDSTYKNEEPIISKVFVSFVVSNDGSIYDVKALKNPDALLSKRVVELVEKMPKWIPGKLNNMKVNVRISLPINISLK